MDPPGCPVHRRQLCVLSASVGGDQGRCPVQDYVDCFSRSDYLELVDLVNPPPSSSSSSSSCITNEDVNQFSTGDVLDLMDLVNPTSPSSENAEEEEEVQSKPSTPAISGSVVPGEISQSAYPLDMGHPSPDLDSNEKTESKNASRMTHCQSATRLLPVRHRSPMKGKKFPSGKRSRLV